jgi:hypothetical protein
MATAGRTVSVPATLEITKSFEAPDLDREELEELQASLHAPDLSAELEKIFGRVVTELRFLRATWKRFRQFVQQKAAGESGGEQGRTATGEVTTRVETRAGDY